MRQDPVGHLVEDDLAIRQCDLDRFDPVQEPPGPFLNEIAGLALAAGPELHGEIAIGRRMRQPHLAFVIGLALAEPVTGQVSRMFRGGYRNRHQHKQDSRPDHQLTKSQDGI